MSAARWIPDDGELDALARTLPASEPSAERVEQNRTSVLAAAASVAQRPRRVWGPLLAVGGVMLAAAAALVLYLAGRGPTSDSGGGASTAKETIAELQPSRFERGAWPSYRLALHDGRLAVRVAALEAADRFTVITADAEVEVRGARFVVAAARDRIEEVIVEEGAVELRLAHQQPVFLAAGGHWSAPRTARADELAPVEVAKTEPLPRTEVSAPPRAPATALDRGSGARRIASTTGTPQLPREALPRTAPPAEPPREAPPREAPPAEAPARPGESEFRRGWTALRAGDPATAASAFARACDDSAGDALGEDACYWAGAAARRAGRTTEARAALGRFLQRFPSAGRAGEAAALLGWLLYEANELDDAERHFRRAASDRVPTVRASAERGLEAVARKRPRR